MSQSRAERSGWARNGSRIVSVAAIGGTSIAGVARDRLLKLAAIATAAGAFSGLFGVGGGTVIVPLLIFWFAFGEREATGTSLAAIVLIALFAAVAQGLYGNVDLLEGMLVGIPAVGGVVVGTALQQRLPERTISLLFAALLVVIALELAIP
jgi:uncharacterized membrane protein YfcA